MLIASVLLPGVSLPGFFLVRWEEMLALVLLPALLSRPGKRFTGIDWGFILLAVSMLISTMWGAVVFRLPLSPRDMMEFVKVAKAWVLFRITLRPWLDKELLDLSKIILTSLLISAFIGVVEWRDWLGLTAILQRMYSTGTGNVGTWRMIGTVGNPNYYGLLMVVGLLLAISMWNYNQRRIWRLMTTLVAGGCGFVLFLTNSRSSILAAVLAICLLFLIRARSLQYKTTWRLLNRVRWQVFILTILLIVATIWTWRQFQIANTLTSPAEIASFRQGPVRQAIYRLSQVERGFETRIRLLWAPNFDFIIASPVFGWGPAKAAQRTVTDNGYILTLRRYGMVGIVFFLLLYIQVGKALMKSLYMDQGRSIRARLAGATLVIIAGYLGANLFLEVFYSLQLMSWLWLLIGISVSSAVYAPRGSISHDGRSEILA